jgi:DNA repair protein RecN (Recombination protein N)
MLVQLTISNFAIIQHLETSFRGGLNILSGETGAGKSIIINAVNLILGGRASSDLIRTGCDEARVEALFTIPQDSTLREILHEMGFDSDGDILIKRVVSREGRNRTTINGSMATLQMLGRVGLLLLSISGQHEHQALLRPENHLFLLDQFGGLLEERAALAESFEAFQILKENLRRLNKKIGEEEARKDLRQFQIEEIEKAALLPEEDQRLEKEKRRLRHGEELKQMITGSYHTIYEKDDSILGALSSCARDLEKGADLDGRLATIRDQISSAILNLEEAAMELRSLDGTISDDPYRLEEVEDRLQLLNRLKKKYGPSLKEVVAFQNQLARAMDTLDQKYGNRNKLVAEVDNKEKGLLAKSADLSRKRRLAAEAFAEAVEKELVFLDMGGTRFQVQFKERASEDSEAGVKDVDRIKRDGLDEVEFMISPNVGESLRPLSKTASGGELSRIMLALKTILAKKASLETVVFDEVDAGIGGRTAEVVGEKLASLAQYHQILCITHLPQIASKGSTHFRVMKRVAGGRTTTVIAELDKKERVEELARLLGGKKISSKARDHARELVESA